MAKSISEAMTRAMKKFRTSLKMWNLNIEFSQEVFIKNFELCEGRIAQRFPEFDLSFLEEEDDVDAGPSNTIVNLSFDELTSRLSESTADVSNLVRKLEVIESDPALSSEVEILE
ncbi:hypothetical protein COCNU_scaffold008112G000010 [Cocos nucifera]|nr:hypothetical protein [Cocos nucifera]